MGSIRAASLLRLSCKEQPVALCVLSDVSCRFAVVTEACRAVFSADPVDLVGAELAEYLLGDVDRVELQQIRGSDVAVAASQRYLVKSRCGAFVWVEKLNAIPSQFLDKCLQRINTAVCFERTASCNSLSRSNSEEQAEEDSRSLRPQHLRNHSEHLVSINGLDALYWNDAPTRKLHEFTHAVTEQPSAEYSFADVFEEDFTSTESSPATDIYPRKHHSGASVGSEHPKPVSHMPPMARKESSNQLVDGDWGWFFDMGSPG